MLAFPSYKQLDKMDCGPTCLKIISKFYGKNQSLQVLRDRCGVTKEGASFYDISYAAESIGLRTLALKLTKEQFLQELPFPAIIHWRKQHFVVLYKRTSSHVYVSDPAIGLQKYNLKTFIENWIPIDSNFGNILFLEPQPGFDTLEETEISNSKTLKDVFIYLKPYKNSLYKLMVVLLIITGLQAALPFLSRSVIDIGIRTANLDFINIILIANVVLLVSIAVGNVTRDMIVKHVSARLGISLISDYLITLMKMPITYFESRFVGDLLQRAADHESIKNFVTNSSFNVLFSIFTFIIFSVILGSFNLNLLLIFLIGTLIYIMWIIFFQGIEKKLDYKYYDLLVKNNTYWIETVSSMIDIKINNNETQRRWNWEKIQARIYHINMKMMTINHSQEVGSQLINGLKNLFLTFFIAREVVNGNMTMGMMISTQFIIGFLNSPITQFISFIQNAQKAKISFERLREVNGLPQEETNIKQTSFNLPKNKDIRFSNVSFQYSRTSPVILKGLNFVIKEHKTTAIVGSSGSGKTTLLKLILRLYLPSHGTIELGDINMQNINLKKWRESCSAVLQESKIFNNTVLNNVVFDAQDIDYDRLRQALESANILDSIESLSAGYETYIGENGIGLSHGQKQRLLIARALYRNPDTLILDEATNALDSLNERTIINNFRNLKENKTVIISAHRLSTIIHADHIIVLKEGVIVESGSYHGLLKKREHFYELFQDQLSNHEITQE
jgi:ATP-binding cassette subfamily B protein